MEQRNIVLVSGSGVYGAVSKYITEFAAAFRELGYHTVILDGNLKSFRDKYRYLKEHISIYALVDCQAMVADVLPECLEDSSVPRVHYLCDHPLYLYERLERLNESDIILNVDARHTAYLKKYYPRLERVAYVPLSGTGADIQKPYQNREIGLLFTGSYWVPQMPVHKTAEMGFADSVKWSVQTMLTGNPYLSVEDALEKVLESCQVTVGREEFAAILSELSGVEFYAREYYRDRMIRTLLKAGVDVWVYGNGWEKLLCPGREHLHVMDGGAEVARRALGEAKIVLNIMPGFKAGFQERIAAAMLSGAVVVTDISDYLKENFSNGKEMVFYELDHLEELPSIIQSLQENPVRSEKIAENGKRVAQKQHTWMQRVIQMAEQIEVYHGKTADFEANAGGELTVPLCELRESYVVEEIGVRLSEEISRLNDLEHCGCAVQEDVDRLTGYLREWEKQLRERCGYRFFSGNNLEVFLADCGSVRQLLLMADGMLCGIREKYDAAALEEFASGLGAGENRLLYQKAVTRLFKERYKEKEDPWIKLWKQDLEAGTILQSCPGAVCARYEQAVSGLLYDASCDMFYVMIDGKPLYYPQEFSDEQVLERYRKLCEEQDRESAHCYRNGNLQIPDGAVIMDAGAAEGYFALTVIEHAGRVYLTDRDERWNAAWQKTFAPYRDKVVFLHGVLGGSEAGCDVMTIDDIIGTGRLDFLKVDVGGAEQEVLLGAQKVLGNAAAMRCVVAAYHTHESEAQIEHILRENGFQTDRADGYFLHMDYEKPVWENELRHALVWAERN